LILLIYIDHPVSLPSGKEYYGAETGRQFAHVGSRFGFQFQTVQIVAAHLDEGWSQPIEIRIARFAYVLVLHKNGQEPEGSALWQRFRIGYLR
jgi:hypothetical protein